MEEYTLAKSCFGLKKLDIDTGMGLGLFAIFGIIRYRTDAIEIKEMTYLFLIIGLIIYFYPKHFEESSKNKLEMFRVNGVETVAVNIKDENKFKYYESIIKLIKNGI